MLSDVGIRSALMTGMITISPVNYDNIQPASYDVTLDANLLVPYGNVTEINLGNVQPNHMQPRWTGPFGYILQPGKFILGCTSETLILDKSHVGRIEGKSSLGRLGLLVHATAGFIDPGFHGQLTLELYNAAPWDLILIPGQKIAQISFSRLSSPAVKSYGEYDNHYQYQIGPQESKFGMKKD